MSKANFRLMTPAEGVVVAGAEVVGAAVVAAGADVAGAVVVAAGLEVVTGAVVEGLGGELHPVTTKVLITTSANRIKNTFFIFLPLFNILLTHTKLF
jgi:hypothetical protein